MVFWQGSEFQYLQVGGCTILLAVAIVLIRRLNNPYTHVPGPWYSNWTGIVFNCHTLMGKEGSYLHSIHLRYGEYIALFAEIIGYVLRPVVRVSPFAVDTISAVDAQQIHGIKRLFCKSGWYEDFIPGNQNLVNVRDVQVHRRHRRLLSAPLSESSLKMVLPQVERKVQLAIFQMKQEMDARGVVDVLKWWTCMATDVIGELTFGESFLTLESGKQNQYMRDLEATGATNAMLASFPTLYRFGRFVPALKEAKAIQDRLRSYAEQSLARYQDGLEKNPGAITRSLFTKLYQAHDEETLTDKEINEEAQIYIVAGSDTTANTLTYLIWRLCLPENAHLKARLTTELDTLPGGEPTEKELKSLPYLNKVICETLRLHSAVPGCLRRIIPEGGAVIGGFPLPAGGEVMTNAYCLHRNEEVFPNAEEFDPDRWENPTKQMKDAYLPFGGGSRVCIGLHLANAQLRMGAAHFFMAFPNAVVSAQDGMCREDMDPALYFLMAPRGHRCLVEVR